MNILVCMKQIPDPEVPARDFRLDAPAPNLVTNIFCENALETALQFRDRGNAAKITALSFGPPSAEDTLRKALAMKADAAALVVDDSGANHNPLTVARVLAAAIRKLGTFDLILTGRESGDWGAGQTGALLAEELAIPYVAFVDSIEPGLRLERQTETGFEIVEATPPLVVTITNDEHNVPRIPKVRDVMMAHRQPLTQWTMAEIGVEPAEYYEVVELAIPQRETRCEMVDVDTLAQRILEVVQ